MIDDDRVPAEQSLRKRGSCEVTMYIAKGLTNDQALNLGRHLPNHMHPSARAGASETEPTTLIETLAFGALQQKTSILL